MFLPVCGLLGGLGAQCKEGRLDDLVSHNSPATISVTLLLFLIINVTSLLFLIVTTANAVL